MAREHGKSGRVMISPTGSAAAVVVTLSEWTLNMTQDQVDVTSFGDANKTYVTGLKDLQGTISGFWDSASESLFSAADSTDGSRMYLYPDFVNNPAKYWYGTANVSASITTAATGAVGVSGSFSARGSWGRNYA